MTKNFLDIHKFAQDHNLSLAEEGEHHHAHNGWTQIHCPFCRDGSYGFHLGFSLEQGNFNCWSCGHKTAWEVVGKILNTRDKSLISRTLREYSKEGSFNIPTKEKVRTKTVEAPVGIEPLTEKHQKYLMRRKYNPNELETIWGVQGTTFLSGRWNWRIVIPIKNAVGEIVAYQGRTIGKDVKPKYLLTDDDKITMDPKSIIYGLDKVPGDTILIVEGITDVWRFGPGTVGLLGIDWTKQQANIIRKYPHRFIMLDPEEKAQRQAQKLSRWLATFPGETHLIDGLKTDPGDMTKEEVKEIKTMIGWGK